MEEAQVGRPEGIRLGQGRGRADVTGEHPGPLDRVDRPVEGRCDRRLEESLAKPDAQIPGQDLDHVLGGQWIAPGEQLGEDRPFRRRAGGGLDRAEGGGDVARLGGFADRRSSPVGPAEQVGHRDAKVG